MSEYENLLIEIKLKHNQEAKAFVPKLCYTLKKEDPLLSDKDIGEWVKRDLIDIWSRSTIYENLPEEFKDEEKSKQTKEGIKQKKVRERTPTASDVKQKNDTELYAAISPRSDLTPIELSATGEPINEEPEAEPKPDPPATVFKLPDLTWHQNDDIDYKSKYEEDQLRIGKLEEQLREQTEHYQSVLKAINDNKNKAVIESKEYKALESELYLVQEENKELKQIESNRIKDHPEQTFQSAASIPQQPNQNSRIPEQLEVEFPAKEISTFFLDSRNVKSVMYLQINGNKVTGWQSDYLRQKLTKT